MTMVRRSVAPVAMVATLALVALASSGCATATHGRARALDRVPDATAVVPAAAERPALSPLARRVTPDVVARFATPPPPGTLGRVAALVPSDRQTTMRLGPAGIDGKTVSAAGVDPETFRAFTPPGTAEVTDVWAAAAAGDVIASYATAERLRLPLGGTVTMTGTTGERVSATVGAFADTALPDVDVVVSHALADKLGLPSPNAVLLAGTGGDPGDVARAARRLSLPDLQVDLLRAVAQRTTFFDGGAMRQAFGVLHYQETSDGKVIPDPAWVRANIVRVQVPILGWVMCHRLMIPQMSSALAEIEAEGLAGSIHPDQYEGCYVPKLIEDSNSISMHTWGLAFDINVPTNQRGTHGDMDPRVVTIFKRWGFRWGGDWKHVPDPMHFELAALMQPGH